MKRFKNVLILSCILLVFLVVTFIVMRTEEKKEQIQNTDAIILEVSPDAVQALSWSYEDTSLSFQKEDGVWYWDEDAAFPVEEEAIQKLLAVFQEFGASFIIEEVEDYNQYGLDSSTCTITLATADASYEVTLGDYSTMDAERYVSIGDGNVYLVKVDPMDTYEITLEDLICLDAIPTPETVTELTFSGLQNYSIRNEGTSDDAYCSLDSYYTDHNGVSVALDTELIESYYTALCQLGLTDYVSYNVTDAELAAYGLDTPELSITMQYTTTDSEKNEITDSFTLQLGRNQEELAAKEAAEAEGEDYTGTVTAYARVEGSSIVYAISESEYTALVAVGYEDLCHKEVLPVDFDRIAQIDIVLDGTSYTFTAQAGETEDDTTTYWNGEEQIDVTTLESKLTYLSVNSFTDEKAEGKKEVSLTVTLDDEAATTMTIVLYRYNGTLCLVTRDGETVGFVSRTSAMALVEAIYAIVLG